jgi:DNA-binding LacI/PurR family transcriptional regulator
VAHLIALGHRTIGLIGWTTGGPLSFAGRREGSERALREGGLAPQVIETVKLDREGAYEATLQLLHRVPDMTAIFTCNDEMAIGVLVVGFDNIDLAREIQPSLTTVHVQKTWMGNIGLRRLIERAQNPDQPRTTTTIATSLIIRESTCPPRAELGGHTT